MLQNARESYDRTMAIVGSGLASAKEYLAQQKALIESNLGVA